MRFIWVFLMLTTVFASDLHKQWNDFKLEYNKHYTSFEEEQYRLRVFEDNLKQIDQHNALYDAGQELYRMGITRYVDMTEDEYRSYVHPENQEEGEEEEEEYPYHDFTEVFGSPEVQPYPPPQYCDHRYAPIDRVRDEGNCHCSWAFAMVDVLEAHYHIDSYKTKNVSLSVQRVLDCTGSRCYRCQCLADTVGKAFKQQKHANYSMWYENEYPYRGYIEGCFTNKTRAVFPTKNLEFDRMRTDSFNLKHSILFGPIAAMVDSKEWQKYSNGIFVAKEDFKRADRSVVIYGYDTENGTDYWIVKNSQGKSFGENGYIRIAADKGKDIGITNHIVIPKFNF